MEQSSRIKFIEICSIFGKTSTMFERIGNYQPNRENERTGEHERVQKWKQYQKKLEIEEMKIEMKWGYEKERKYNSKEQGSIQVKLPNLMISKF